MFGKKALFLTIFLAILLYFVFLDGSTRVRHQSVADKEYHIYAIGDLHGDLPNTLKILRMAGLVDEMNNWAANDSILVQTGDIVVFRSLHFRIEGRILCRCTSSFRHLQNRQKRRMDMCSVCLEIMVLDDSKHDL